MESRYPNYGFTKSKEEILSQEDIINPLPRAVLRPNQYILLDGDWKFALDKEDIGLQEGWFLWHQFNEKAHWPGSIEAQINKGKEDSDKPAWQDKVVVWYEREFPMPDLSHISPPSLLQLTFGACGYETRVWLNGSPLSTVEGEQVHIGEYTSFSYEISENSLQLVNRISVRIAATMDADIPRGKQESHVYRRGGIWYQTYTGAVRSIWLEMVERNRLRSRVGIVSTVENGQVLFKLITRIQDPGNYTLRLKVYNRTEDSILATSDYSLYLEPGQERHQVVLEIPDAKLWSPEVPHLHRLVAQLIDARGYIAEIETHFGLRKIEARGSLVYLNSKPIYLDGILYQPRTATFEEIKRHIYAIKALGCNLIRIHMAGVDPRIYNLADRIGMLLWVEVPSPHRSTPMSRANHRGELLRMLSLMAAHPSIVIWSLYNEDWGAQDIATNPETREYITSLYHYMQLAHPQFLVVDNDGWHHVSFGGKLTSDLLTAHLYTSDIQRWQHMLDDFVAGQMENVAAFPLVVGDRFFYRGQVPLVVSEWGNFKVEDSGELKNADERAELILFFKKELRERRFAGDIYMQATNIEDEQSGLIDLSTSELKVPAGLLNSRINVQATNIEQNQMLGKQTDELKVPFSLLNSPPKASLVKFNSCFISYSTQDEEFARLLYSHMSKAQLEVWFAPEDIKGGKKLGEQIENAIRYHDRLLIVLSKRSMQSEWVFTEIRRALKTEIETGRRKLFPIRIVDFETIKEWELIDADTGKDLAVEVRSFFIPDFSNWKDKTAFNTAFEKLLRDLKDED